MSSSVFEIVKLVRSGRLKGILSPEFRPILCTIIGIFFIAGGIFCIAYNFVLKNRHSKCQRIRAKVVDNIDATPNGSTIDVYKPVWEYEINGIRGTYQAKRGSTSPVPVGTEGELLISDNGKVFDNEGSKGYLIVGVIMALVGITSFLVIALGI